MAICYIVATPIGNLADLSQRALETLKSVAVVFAEDTRVSGRLLSHFGISAKLLSLHEHNERERTAQVVRYLEEGESVAIISDAGTPLISDPGYPVVAHLRQHDFDVIPIPGPSAIITALSVSGLPTDRFTFEGFLPSKKGERVTKLLNLQSEPRTMVFYESSHRITAMLSDAVEVFGEHHPAFFGREMTKHFEEYRGGTLGELLTYLTDHSDKVRGEFVVAIGGVTESESDQSSVSDEALLTALLAEGIPVKQAVKVATKLSATPKNRLYEMALTLK